MHIRTALTHIYSILDEDEPLKHVGQLRRLLNGMRLGLEQSGLDDDALELAHEYLDTWLVEDAIKEDIDSFIEETNDIYEKVVGEDEEEDDEDDGDDLDDDMLDDEF
ncbi:MAG: hypothetical protein IKY83_10740 [Proteobacteria bacterium]|nr:hypothetical protein [Pseudomonadota bacterium]